MATNTDAELTDDEWEFISERKRIQYDYAKPYLPATTGNESEAELWANVRDAIRAMPDSERAKMRCAVSKARREIFAGHSVRGI